MKKWLINLILFTLAIPYASAQQKTNAQQLVDKVNTFHNTFPTEKLYLSFDKNNYSIGDTIWFKTYLLDANHLPQSKSGKVYVELLNDSSLVVDRLVIPIELGLGWGEIKLKESYKQGNYVVRAYTNFQQNFGNSFFFTRSFSLGFTDEKNWLISASQNVETSNALIKIALSAKLTNEKNEAIGLEDLEVTLLNDNKVLAKTTMQTAIDGMITKDFSINKHEIGKNTSLIIQSKLDKNHKLTIPIQIGDKGNIDLQFMPEGGDLVEDQRGKVAFKALNQDGIGINIAGKIINNKREQVAIFESKHKGMGSFLLTPTPGDTYTAVLTLPNGQTETFPLPLPKKNGTSLRIDNLSNPDSLLLYIRASKELRALEHFTILAQNGDRTVYAAAISLKEGFYNAKLAKKDLSNGITHFTLFSPSGSPINERQIMTGDLTKIKLDIVTDKVEYKVMDSVEINLRLMDKSGSPIPSGSFNVSVTDNRMVNNSTSTNHIIAHYLLTSNLKGNVEDPNWYFSDQSKKTEEALDLLLLTQGWIGYDWSQILTRDPKPTFKFESANSISGRVTSPLIKKPLANLAINLLTIGKEISYTNTLSQTDGSFNFDVPLIDSVAYLIKVKNQRGKSSTANIIVDEFTPTVFKTNTPLPQKLWYLNTDSSALNYLKSIQTLKKISAASLQGTALKEVVITGKTVYKSTDGNWNADLNTHINEEKLKKTPRLTLYQLLSNNVRGFGTGMNYHYIGSPKSGVVANVVVDGISTSAASGGGDIFSYNNFFFNYVNAEDIKDIKTFRSPDFSIIIITTRSGSGPFVKRSYGNYVYRPLSIHIPRRFYRPKYTNASAPPTSDLRSTIFWEPNMMIDQTGQSRASFFAGTTPSQYTIVAEGTDLNGNFAYAIKTIKIVARKTNP